VLYVEGQGSSVPVLYAFNATTGAALWNVTLGDDGFFTPLGSPIAAYNGLVFAGCAPASQYAGICAFRYFGGHLIWSDFPGCPGGNPTCALIAGPQVGKGVVYEEFQAEQGSGQGFAAYDAATGASLWSYGFSLNTLGRGLPILAGGLVDFGCANNSGFKGVCAFSQATGQPEWLQQTGDVVNALSSGGGLVFANLTIAAGPEELYAFNAATGAPKWVFTYNTPGSLNLEPAAYANGVLYLKTTDGNLVVLNSRTGNVLWEGVGGCSIASAPVIANGVVYLNCQGLNGPGTLAVSARTGAPLWKRPNNGSTLGALPIVWNGTVYSSYAACGGNDLCVYGLP
jgi:outer membrane protein assembly factor BamB